MADVDTRSDVYSLGVILYELLSGALPFDASSMRSGGYSEIQRIIREVDPPRPSTRLSTLEQTSAKEVARCRQTPLRSTSISAGESESNPTSQWPSQRRVVETALRVCPGRATAAKTRQNQKRKTGERRRCRCRPLLGLRELPRRTLHCERLEAVVERMRAGVKSVRTTHEWRVRASCSTFSRYRWTLSRGLAFCAFCRYSAARVRCHHAPGGSPGPANWYR